ncbi:MAG TPA: agmatinase [Gaiellaceae bacterium]|nr:agmatinase [Gaiellaceae bacterium]
MDCAIFGMPWDGATTFRPGARFGPEAVRSASGMVRTYNTAQRTQVFGAGSGTRLAGALSCVDYGDAPTVPGYVEETLRRIEAFVRPIVEADVVPVGIGGDHSVTLAELRAVAQTTGPLGLVHIDSHGDLWDDNFGVRYNHGTMFRRAIEEGILDPARMIQAGIRGPLYTEEDTRLQENLGVELIPWLELCDLAPSVFADRVRARVGSGPTFLTFDVDFVDAAFLPGTGTPEIGGPTPHEALQFLRALDGIDFRAFDVVEVSPPYDGPGQMTALFAAQAVFECLSLVARARAGRN